MEFYRDTVNTFECSVHINGTSTTQTEVRLVFEFDGRKILFDGYMDGNRAIVQIPKLLDIEDTDGYARLEVIADTTYFVPWESSFVLSDKRSVDVDDVSVARLEPVSVVVEDVKLDQRSEDIVSEDDTVDIFVSTVSKKNRKWTETVIKRYADTGEKVDVSFTPTDVVRSWASEVFVDTDSDYAIAAMVEVQRGIDKK